MDWLPFFLAALILDGFTTTLLLMEIRRNQNEKIEELKGRVKQLEQANHWRMSYTSTREIENAQATGAVAEKYAVDLVDIIRNMQAHLSKAHYPNKEETK